MDASLVILNNKYAVSDYVYINQAQETNEYQKLLHCKLDVLIIPSHYFF